MAGSECIRCGTSIDDREERFVAEITIVRGNDREILDDVVLCGPCGYEYKGYLTLETTQYKRLGSR